MQIKNFAVAIGILSGFLFGIATPFSKILLANLNTFQLSGLLYIGSSIVILPSIIKKLFNFHVFEKNNKNKNKIKKIPNFPILKNNSENKKQLKLKKIKNLFSNNNLFDKKKIKNIFSNNNLFDKKKIKNIFSNNNLFDKKKIKNIFSNNNLKIILILLFGGILGPLFLMMGLSSIMASSVAIWLNMELVATAILGVLIFKDHLDKYSLIGLILTFSAGLIISWEGGFGEIVPILFIILACFSWGIDNQLTSIVDGYSPEFITFLKGVFGGGINFTIGMYLASTWIPFDILFYALILGIISYGLSIFLFVSSAQNLGATRSQILFSSAPFWGILLSILILDESLTLNIIVAICFLAAGILISNNLIHSHEHEHSEIEHIHLHSHDDSHHDHGHEDSYELDFENKDPIEKNNLDNRKKHVHMHKHSNMQHEHRHFPDLHHKHAH